MLLETRVRPGRASTVAAGGRSPLRRAARSQVSVSMQTETEKQTPAVVSEHHLAGLRRSGPALSSRNCTFPGGGRA